MAFLKCSFLISSEALKKGTPLKNTMYLSWGKKAFKKSPEAFHCSFPKHHLYKGKQCTPGPGFSWGTRGSYWAGDLSQVPGPIWREGVGNAFPKLPPSSLSHLEESHSTHPSWAQNILLQSSWGLAMWAPAQGKGLKVMMSSLLTSSHWETNVIGPPGLQPLYQSKGKVPGRLKPYTSSSNTPKEK